ncbi:MAG: hypothetical protein BMS9Abin11_0415 [Gammaproteobacteria bacterium]|nr:MAG: hypothetical protein BMS9Abin11_0415 [Gammaproteobacteria bacterium]
MIDFVYPGRIFHDLNFPFQDGNAGNKLFVVLNDGACGYYIVARTTTNEDYRSKIKGCNLDDRRPNYFIPSELNQFPENTWICLNYLSDFEKVEFDKRVKNNEINGKGLIDNELFLDIARCAAYADDTTSAQEAEIIKFLDSR